MKEITFLKSRHSRWEEFEKQLQEKSADPRQLATLFIELTDDLSYAQTHYPDSKTTRYLNDVTARAHQEIYKNKKENRGRIARFWKEELPLVMAAHKKQVWLSVFIFGLFTVLGFVSELYDENFVRIILGDAYVDETIERIKKGNPMGIYGEGDQSTMFLRITINNIFVSFQVFALGVLFSVGTAYELFRNGVMLGSFQAFFYKYHVFVKSLLVIWIHGTLEISSIIIAGAAGFTLGNSILFPGTYTRLESFKRGAQNSLKIIIGIVPVFIIAGFLESFVTRYTHMPAWLSIGIIGTSLLFITGYFLILPSYIQKQKNMYGKN